MIIVYETEDGKVSVITPNSKIQEVLNIDAIAQKDVPANVRYWIIDRSELPSYETRDRWVLEDMPEQDGVGADSNRFADEDLLLLKRAGVLG